MKFKTIILVAVLFLSFSLTLVAEEKLITKPMLKAGDVEHFIKTFNVLSKDLKALGAEYDARSGNMSYPDALMANTRFQELLKKHGWDTTFFQKASVIGMAYSVVVYGKEYKKANPEMDKALKEIEANPHLTAEQKKQMRDGIIAAKAGLAAGEQAMTKMVDPADIQLVKPLIAQLKTVLEKNN